MIVEERTYTLVAGGPATWFRVYEEFALEVQTRILGNLIGYFMTDVGTINQIVHLWGYENAGERERRRAELYADEDWHVFQREIGKHNLIVKMESRILVPAPFSPIR